MGQSADSYVSPANPELFASGVVINGFTPSDKREMGTLVETVRKFDVNVVLVLESERLFLDLEKNFRNSAVKIVQLPKQNGVQAPKQAELDKQMFTQYQDFFRGEAHASFSVQDRAWEETFGPELAFSRVEYDPYDLKIQVDEIRIFEVKGHEIPLSALPAGSTSPKQTTLIEEIRHNDLPLLSQKILANVVPPDEERIKHLEQEMTLYPNNHSLKEEFENILLNCSSATLMQVKDYHVEERTLEIRSATSNDLASQYFLASNFKLSKLV